MEIVCKSCNTSHYLSDDKIPLETKTGKCKQCSTPITILGKNALASSESTPIQSTSYAINNQNKNMLRAKFLQTGEIIFNENKKGISYPQAIKKEIKPTIFSKNKENYLEHKDNNLIKKEEKNSEKVGFFKKIFSAIWWLIKWIVTIIVITIIIVIVYKNYFK
jgi:predicted Zn finger-like uncharacterized protein